MKSGRVGARKLELNPGMNFGSTSTLFASLIWGSLGVGFAVYGKRQRAPGPLVGGIALVAISYFLGSALVMSLVGAALVAGIIWYQRQNG